MSQVLALIDGNSFYYSCERVFDPKLDRRPVIVLSNNDGCAVSCTPEAKALGIKMGAPMFQIRNLCKRVELATVFKFLRSGDELVVPRLDQLAENSRRIDHSNTGVEYSRFGMFLGYND